MPEQKTNLNPDEIVVIQLALNMMIEDLETVNGVPYPFNPDAKQHMNEILSNAKSARDKIIAVSGHEVQLDKYEPGDEQQFFTKES